MFSFKRITPEEANEAYELTKIAPLRANWQTCPLGVIAKCYSDTKTELDILWQCQKSLGSAYTLGFLLGVDFQNSGPMSKMDVSLREIVLGVSVFFLLSFMTCFRPFRFRQGLIDGKKCWTYCWEQHKNRCQTGSSATILEQSIYTQKILT